MSSLPVELSPADHVRNLLGRYCRLVDSGDFAGVGRMFARGALADQQGRAFARGAGEVERNYGMLLLHGDPPTPRTQHLVLNTVLAPLSDGRLGARSSYVVLQAVGEMALQPIITGSYDDTFAHDADHREDGGWHFVERRFGMRLSGRLDQHIPGFTGG